MKITKENEQDIILGAIIGGFSGWLLLILIVAVIQFYINPSSFGFYTLEPTVSKILGIAKDPPSLKYSPFLLVGAILGGLIGGTLGGYQWNGKLIYSQRFQDSFYLSIPVTFLIMAQVLSTLNESTFNVALFFIAEITLFAYLTQFAAAYGVQVVYALRLANQHEAKGNEKK
ncbi:MAG: hypothetical protein ACFFDT_16595 [Candidatus Hodarchaeota archaeon]